MLMLFYSLSKLGIEENISLGYFKKDQSVQTLTIGIRILQAFEGSTILKTKQYFSQ